MIIKHGKIVILLRIVYIFIINNIEIKIGVFLAHFKYMLDMCFSLAYGHTVKNVCKIQFSVINIFEYCGFKYEEIRFFL